MVGNDVVDLRDEDATAQHAPRFDARVFCDDELRALDAAPDRARLRWQLWAAKEAAYKLRVKQDPDVVFAPSRFRTRLGEDPESAGLRGSVETPGGPRVPVVVEEHDAGVHAVACDDAQRVVSGMTRLVGGALDTNDPEAPGREARRLATERIASVLGVEAASLDIRKTGRLPRLWIGDEPRADLSLSHHGRLVAFACEIGGTTEPAGRHA